MIKIEPCKIAVGTEPGIVYQPIDLERMFLRFFEKPLVGVRFGQIECDIMRRDLMFKHQFVAKLVKRLFGSGDQDKIVLIGRQPAGKSLANSAGCSRDKSYLHRFSSVFENEK